MHTIDPGLTRFRMRLVSTRAAVLVLVVSVATLGVSSAQAALITKCPSAQALKAAAGTALTLKTSTAGADVFCDYTHPISATLQDNVNLSVEPLNESAAALENTERTNAKGLKAPFKTLSGIGTLAWEYTEPKSNLDGGGNPTTTVSVVVNKREVTVISNLKATNVLAIAKFAS